MLIHTFCLHMGGVERVKPQGFAGALWSSFGSSELRVQLTSAHV